MWFGCLEDVAAKVFVVQVLATFGVKQTPLNSIVKGIVQSCFIKSPMTSNDKPLVSQAALTEAAFAFVKANKGISVTA